jgi:hypothetical protein
VSEEIDKNSVDLKLYLGIAVERIKPGWAKRSFEKQLKAIWEKYPDNESDRHWERTENQDNRFKLFNELIGSEVQDYDFVDKCLNDVSYLHLAIVAEKLDRDVGQELQTYQEACGFLDNLQFRNLKDHKEYENIRSKTSVIVPWVETLLTDIEERLWDE